MVCFLKKPAVVIMIALAFLSCEVKTGRDQAKKKLSIVTTLFPLYDFTKNIAGDKANVSLLLPPGVEPHSFEPRPGDMLQINKADIFVYTGMHMEPWVKGLLKGVDNRNITIVDASKGIILMGSAAAHVHEGKKTDDHADEQGRSDKGYSVDPHIWLDFANAQKMVDNILEGLVTKDSVNKEYYTKNADDYKTKLEGIDKKYRMTLKECKKNIFIHGGHFAFNYLAKRYNLTYVSAYKGIPDSEPSPKRIAELKTLMDQYGIRSVYYEELIAPRVAEILSRETGAGLLRLHGAHNISKSDLDNNTTFLSIMEDNLKSLKKGLECR